MNEFDDASYQQAFAARTKANLEQQKEVNAARQLAEKQQTDLKFNQEMARYGVNTTDPIAKLLTDIK